MNIHHTNSIKETIYLSDDTNARMLNTTTSETDFKINNNTLKCRTISDFNNTSKNTGNSNEYIPPNFVTHKNNS